jgi:hypothetical protein
MRQTALTLPRLLTALLLMTGILVQSCSKKNDIAPDPGGVPGETATLKYVPDSMFRVYLKKNVCPNAFDKSGKLIDITNSEVKNFAGTMTIDTVTCPAPYVSSLRGVEYFSKMTKLIVNNSPLDSLDLPKTMAIDTLKLINTIDMQYVNVAGLTSMRYIKATYLPIVSLDLSNLPALEYAALQNMGRVSEVKTDNDANLKHFMAFGLTGIKSVNVSTNPELQRLNLDYAYSVNSVDVTHNRKLRMILVRNSSALKNVDLSKNDSLRSIDFDDSGIDSVDVSHNLELITASMARSNVRNLNFLNNPKLISVNLEGCGLLKTADLRAQTTFNLWFVPASKYIDLPEADWRERFQNGFVSPVQTAECSEFNPASRVGVGGATTNLYAGLRLPNYLDGNGFVLQQVKVNDAVKDNYSLVMSRRVISAQPPVVTVYAADKTTVVCSDYSPEQFHCN